MISRFALSTCSSYIELRGCGGSVFEEEGEGAEQLISDKNFSRIENKRRRSLSREEGVKSMPSPRTTWVSL